MELIEDTQYALGLLNVNNERQLNSNNSIIRAKLINGVQKTNSNEDISRFYREEIEVLDTNPHQIKSATDNIATYLNKVERGHVFTDNNYYLCTNIDQEGNFAIVAQLPIEGNEELINKLRGKDGQRNFKALERTESIAPFITQVKRRGGRTYRNIPSSQRQPRVNGRNDNIHLGQQPHTASNQRPLDRDDDTIIPTTSFRSINPEKSLTDYAHAVVANSQPEQTSTIPVSL